MPAMLVSKLAFSEMLQDKLGIHWDSALAIFNSYGERLSYDVTNVLLRAVDQNKVGEILGILENHYYDHLVFQHPLVRGIVTSGIGVNKTKIMFLKIYQEVLYLSYPFII